MRTENRGEVRNILRLYEQKESADRGVACALLSDYADVLFSSFRQGVRSMLLGGRIQDIPLVPGYLL